MSPALHYEMDDALARLEVDDNVKVVVVTGEGGNFSAGQDRKSFSASWRRIRRNQLPAHACVGDEDRHVRRHRHRLCAQIPAVDQQDVIGLA